MNPAMINKIKKMQKEMMEAQRALEEKLYTGTSGGVVEVKVYGSKEVESIKINKDAIESVDDLDLLEDTLVAALNDAMNKIDEDANKVMSKYTGGMPGFGF